MIQSLYSTEECEKIATDASLRYVQDTIPGIRRKKQGKGFVYYDPKGTRITDKKVLKRIQQLAIPPAYQNVWICPYANGHIQAVGRDSKNRKQYFYHPLWREARQKQKFDVMVAFGESIASIREHVNDILSQPLSLQKQQIICAVLYLLDTSCVRVGNPVYAAENKTYGITTLRKKHLSIDKNAVILEFEGKNSKEWHIPIRNKKMIRILKKCAEIPGYELFKYYDSQGVLNTITSQDINYYLKSLTNHPFTAKDFRTWIATRETLMRLLFRKTEVSDKELLKEVATLLGHTPTICQKSYIHPHLTLCWKEGTLEAWKNKHSKRLNDLKPDELLLFWLKNRDQISN